MTLVGVAAYAVWNWQITHRTTPLGSQAVTGAAVHVTLAAIPTARPAVRIPEFALVDQRGRPVHRSDLDGHVWIADFIFTRCGGQCPMMTAHLAALTRRFPEEANVRFVSFTVDPGYDTPEVLARYAARYEAVADRWLFLTGSQETIYGLSRDVLHLGVQESGGPPAEPIIHSARFVLVGRQGRVRGYYEGTASAAIDALVRDTRALLREPATPDGQSD